MVNICTFVNSLLRRYYYSVYYALDMEVRKPSWAGWLVTYHEGWFTRLPMVTRL